jgi:hypothetical protein
MWQRKNARAASFCMHTFSKEISVERLHSQGNGNSARNSEKLTFQNFWQIPRIHTQKTATGVYNLIFKVYQAFNLDAGALGW